MPVFYMSALNGSDYPPPDIRPYVTDYQWAMIHATMRKIEGTACCTACCLEVIVACVLTPLIFVCHPCIYGAFVSCTRNR